MMFSNSKDSLSIEEHQLKQVAMSHSARSSRRHAVQQTIHENVETKSGKKNKKRERKMSLDSYWFFFSKFLLREKTGKQTDKLLQKILLYFSDAIFGYVTEFNSSRKNGLS